MLRVPVANDNHPYEAEFERIPELFLKTYANEVLGWASHLMDGNQCTIDLWNPPGASIASMGWQGQATLQCDAMAHVLTKKIKFLIRPATPDDEERIAKHCESLPDILNAHRAAAQAAKGKRSKMARWVFDGTVPDYFAQRYAVELREWAANFAKITKTNGAPIKHIILREGVLSNVSPDDEQGAELVQVTIKAKIERVRGDEFEIVCSAADEEQERRIKKHCEKMQRNKVQAAMELVEPPRPGLPFFPTVRAP